MSFQNWTARRDGWKSRNFSFSFLKANRLSVNDVKPRSHRWLPVNGVGPSTAIVMLSYMSSNELKSAIVHEDAATLQSIKGIGGKTALRVIIELKDKLKKESWDEAQPSISIGPHNTVRKEALSALLTLGLSKIAAEKSVDAALKKSGNTITLEDLVKQALKNA